MVEHQLLMYEKGAMRVRRDESGAAIVEAGNILHTTNLLVNITSSPEKARFGKYYLVNTLPGNAFESG